MWGGVREEGRRLLAHTRHEEEQPAVPMRVSRRCAKQWRRVEKKVWMRLFRHLALGYWV